MSSIPPPSQQPSREPFNGNGGEALRPHEAPWIYPPLHGCLYLTGPTGSGKTPLAMELARQLDAEIISLDSMAIYRGMDIGTAKPTAEMRAEVPHHLLDIVEPTDEFSVSAYVVAAHRAAHEIRQRGRRVLLCGGTPLYLKSLLRGLFLGPPADWEFRHAVEEDIQRYGEEALMARLAQVDPLLAHKLHPHDHRRIIRALEVARATGRPLSHWQQQFDQPASPTAAPVVRLVLDRQWLHERINTRVQHMIDAGLVEEVRGLIDRYGRLGRTASQAVGYRELIDALQSGEPLEETMERIRAHTRQFARRQEIWFRSLHELQPVVVAPDRSPRQILDDILNVFRHAKGPTH
ncbi:MAG: tRNA dimethylallyltransferase [Pirellulaceae bacterium]|nr:MAG: tRNA dimethylallyltransferase [Pirellulaceae bacterium]